MLNYIYASKIVMNSIKMSCFRFISCLKSAFNIFIKCKRALILTDKCYGTTIFAFEILNVSMTMSNKNRT